MKLELKTKNELIDMLRSLQTENEKLTKRVLEFENHVSKTSTIELLHKAISENCVDVIWLLDMNLQRVAISPSVAKQRGLTEEEAMQQRLEAGVTKESYEHIQKTLEEELNKDKNPGVDPFRSRNIEVEIYRKDGSTIWTEAHVSFIRDRDFNPIGIFGITRDIAKRKRMEKQLIESEEKYRVIFTDTLEALSLVRKGIIEDVNRPWLQIHGFSNNSEVIGRDIIEFVHPEDRKILLDRRKKGSPVSVTRLSEIRDLNKDGQTLFLEIQSNTILFGGDNYIISSIRDITQRKLAETRLKQANEDMARRAAKLQEANKEILLFANAVSHDLKTPLRAILSFVSFLKADMHDKLSDKQAEYFKQIERSTRDARLLIYDLLELSKVSQYKLHLQIIEIKSFIQKICDKMDGGNVVVEIKADRQPLETEPHLLSQIIQNLLDNAVKFNQSELKLVKIAIKEFESDVEIRMTDNGIGIGEDFYSTIFEPFVRLHSSSEYEGTGIGLSIVKKALDRLKGKISVKSKLNEGTTFSIVLPKKFPDDEDGLANELSSSCFS